MGAWLKQNGYTIYGSHAGYMKPQPWGAITENGNTIWLHIFKSDGDKFFIKMPYTVKSAKMAGHALKVQALGRQLYDDKLKRDPNGSRGCDRPTGSHKIEIPVSDADPGPVI